MPVDVSRFENIPVELRQLKQWVCWQLEPRDEKQTKVPYHPSGRRADTSDPATWSSFEACVAAIDRFSGIGFVFSGEEYTGVDFDHHRDPTTGGLDDFAKCWVERLASYSEVSHSGTGIHVIVRGLVPGNTGRRDAKAGLEMYSKGRFFVMTGQRLEQVPPTVEQAQGEITRLFSEVFGRNGGDGNGQLCPEDARLIKQASAAENGAKFTALWKGDTAAYGSQSEADAALLSMLRFWTSGDKDRAFRLFDQSGLWRDKWARDDYRERTWVAIDNGPVLGGDKDEGAQAKIIQLAALSPIQYDRVREVNAQQLGIRKSTLDKAVAEERQKTQADAGLCWSPIEPWPEAVDGDELLRAIVKDIGRFMVLNVQQQATCALWSLHTHGMELWTYTPILHAVSPDMRCGKSRLFDVLKHFVPRPLVAASVTGPVLFRAIEAFHPTFLVDEFDSLSDELKESVRAVLNSGFHYSGMHMRCVGDNAQPKAFATYGPKAIASIGPLPPTAQDRSIPIALKRKTSKEKVERLRHYDGSKLASQCARWMQDNAEAISNALGKLELPEVLDDRAQDIWEPLLAIAEVIGDPWPDFVRKCAIRLSQSRGVQDETLGVELLDDMRVIFKNKGESAISTAEILFNLNQMEERPWFECCKGKKLHARRLAELLRPFGISSKSLGAAKGYVLDQFQDAFERYLPRTPTDNLAKNPSKGQTA